MSEPKPGLKTPLSLRECLSDLSDGMTREAFIAYHCEPVLVQAYRRVNAPAAVSCAQTIIGHLSASNLTLIDDIEVLPIGHHGTHSFAGSLILAGRDPTLDIVINEKVVSRRHAKFAIEHDGTISIYDMSSDGTFVNGAPAWKEAKTTLENRAVVTFSRGIDYTFFTPQGFYEELELRKGIIERQLRDAS